MLTAAAAQWRGYLGAAAACIGADHAARSLITPRHALPPPSVRHYTRGPAAPSGAPRARISAACRTEHSSPPPAAACTGHGGGGGRRCPRGPARHEDGKRPRPAPRAGPAPPRPRAVWLHLGLKQSNRLAVAAGRGPRRPGGGRMAGCWVVKVKSRCRGRGFRRPLQRFWPPYLTVIYFFDFCCFLV